ncbi:hypothetical protein OO009_01035 [Flavobacteriaceae bacterium KMM 6897]|nr:hypothetical protein [Flavobacteriaceae bacterium KMM 6897]
MMVLKKSLLAAFIFFSIAIHGQTEISPTTAVTAFKVETDHLEELTNFDWDVVVDIFETNAPETEIKIILAYNHKVQFNHTNVDNFELKVGGKTSELALMIKKSKGIIAKLSTVN